MLAPKLHFTPFPTQDFETDVCLPLANAPQWPLSYIGHPKGVNNSTSDPDYSNSLQLIQPDQPCWGGFITISCRFP